MKYLIILSIILMFLYGTKSIQHEQAKIQQGLVIVASERVERERQEAIAREFSNRVQGEATKQGFVGDIERVNVISLVLRYFGKDAGTALAVFRAESGLRCGAISRTGDYGVAQINIVHSWRFKGSMLDCKENIKVAHDIFLESYWYPWSAWKNGHYLNFL